MVNLGFQLGPVNSKACALPLLSLTLLRLLEFVKHFHSESPKGQDEDSNAKQSSAKILKSLPVYSLLFQKKRKINRINLSEFFKTF